MTSLIKKIKFNQIEPVITFNFLKQNLLTKNRLVHYHLNLLK